MKIKKIICMILVICLLGGLLTLNGSAAGWLYDAAQAVSTWLKSFSYNLELVANAVREYFKNDDSTLLGTYFVPFSSNQSALRFTDVNCQFVQRSILDEYLIELLKVGVRCNLVYLTDGAGNGGWFIKATEVFDAIDGRVDDMINILGSSSYLRVEGKWLCAVNDGSSAIAGGGGGRSGRYADEFDSDDGAALAYGDINNFTTITEISSNTTTTTIFNDYSDNSTTYEIVNFETNQVFNHIDNTYYDITHIEYSGDTHNYAITYETNNNTEVVNVAYYIQYTVVNYVELDSTYVLYYQLPDGRNSYDMTVEELSQYSDSFDVINYASSADNEDLLFLFPFNGNQENIAYNGTNFSYSPSLDWTTGNSITYQETSGFGAAMYLGNGDHTFDVTPDYQTNGNYTKYVLSFRYYYSPRTNATAVYYPLTVTVGGYGFSYNGYNNKFSIGRAFNVTTGAPNTTYSDDFSVAMPIGEWSDITLQYAFNNGNTQVYLFINGVIVGSYTDILTVNSITPLFKVRNGTDGYSYIDELIGFKDIYFGSSVGEGFTPTLQPYDTNLILTLPSLQAVTVDSYVEDGKTYYYVYTPDQLWKPTIAVATDIHIMQYYLGGVRPSLPKRGYVWVSINGSVIGTVQVYDGSGWIEVASRVWNGARWMESSNYNIYTNGTYVDLAEPLPAPVIADEQSFWAWCVSSFDTLIATIKSVGGGGGAVADPDVIPEITYPGIDSEGNTTEESTSIFDIVTDVVGGIVDIIGEVVGLGGNVGEFFGNFFDGVGDAFAVLNPNNQNGLFYVEVD